MISGKKIKESQELYVVKSNELIQKARYNLTVQQQKLVLFAISKIKKNDPPDKVYELSIEEVCSVMGLEIDAGGTYYKRIKDDLLKLTNRLWVKFPDRESTISWIGDATIIPLSGTVYIRFHEKMARYLFELRNRYTQYQLYEVLVLKGKYSIRLYELLRSYLMQDELREGKEKEVDFTVDQLREYLCCESYKRWAEFDRCVIRKAVSEINQCSDIIKVSYDVLKHGKNVTRINFIISYPTLMEKFIAHDEQRKRLS
ncbi:MAG: replication initiation protein [Clostridiales bacterium]|nr:replication initiation protein [Clostridiales bacterium]